MRDPPRHFAQGHLGGESAAHNGRNIFGSGPATAFLDTTMNDTHDSSPAIAVKDAYAFRAIETMWRERQKMNSHRLHIYRKPAGARHGIHKEWDSFLGSNFADFTHRLNGADVMIGIMEADKNRFVGDRRAHILGIDPAYGIHLHFCAGETLFFQKLNGVENGWMLDLANHDVVAFALVREGRPFHRQIHRFGSTGGEKNVLRRLCIDECGKLSARFGKRIPHL